MSQPMPHYEPGEQQPVPPARSRKGLALGLIGGGAALVLLVCGAVGCLAIKWLPDKLATPLAQASNPPSQSPSKGQTPRATPQGYSNTIEVGKIRLQVDIDPAKTGDNLVHLFAFTSTGQQQRVEEWKVTASLPEAGIDNVTMPVLKITGHHATGMISLPAPGRWQFQFTLRISEQDQDPVTAQVPIR